MERPGVLARCFGSAPRPGSARRCSAATLRPVRAVAAEPAHLRLLSREDAAGCSAPASPASPAAGAKTGASGWTLSTTMLIILSKSGRKPVQNLLKGEIRRCGLCKNIIIPLNRAPAFVFAEDMVIFAPIYPGNGLSLCGAECRARKVFAQAGRSMVFAGGGKCLRKTDSQHAR